MGVNDSSAGRKGSEVLEIDDRVPAPTHLLQEPTRVVVERRQGDQAQVPVARVDRTHPDRPIGGRFQAEWAPAHATRHGNGSTDNPQGLNDVVSHSESDNIARGRPNRAKHAIGFHMLANEVHGDFGNSLWRPTVATVHMERNPHCFHVSPGSSSVAATEKPVVCEPLRKLGVVDRVIQVTTAPPAAFDGARVRRLPVPKCDVS